MHWTGRRGAPIKWKIITDIRSLYKGDPSKVNW
jgi:hypothetical protein